MYKAGADSKAINSVRLGMVAQLNKDERAAKEHFKVAAHQSDRLGMLFYGVALLKEGNSEGLGWIEKLKKIGFVDAYMTMASLYMKGEIVPKDLNMSISEFEKAFDLGERAAADELAFLYFTGGDGVEKDYDKMHEWAIKGHKGWKRILASLGLLPWKQLYATVLSIKFAREHVSNLSQGDREQICKEMIDDLENALKKN